MVKIVIERKKQRRVFVGRRFLRAVAGLLIVLAVITVPVLVFEVAVMHTDLPDFWDYDEESIFSKDAALSTRDDLLSPTTHPSERIFAYCAAWGGGLGYGFWGLVFLLALPVAIAILIMCVVMICWLLLLGVKHLFMYIFPIEESSW